MNISKELLSEVLGISIEEARFVMIGKSTDYNSINRYELAYKCKEWAFSKGHTVQIEWRHNSSPQDKTRCIIRLGKYGCKGVAETEEEAIFKATQWVYNNKDL